jgi:PAS domain S-box-containing protein
MGTGSKYTGKPGFHECFYNITPLNNKETIGMILMKISVLFVDDDRHLLQITKIYLDELDSGFLIDTAVSAHDAQEKLAIHSYDAIVSDYEMPGMNGIELLRFVRREYGEIPFIIYTGRGREEIVIEAINNGADFYLQKGGEPDAQFTELSHKIRLAVKNHRADLTLHESEEKFREIFNNVNDAVLIQEIDEYGLPGQFTEVNDIACSMLQYTREELFRITPRDFATKFPDAPLTEIGKNLLNNGHFLFEAAHSCKDGSVVPVEVNAHVTTLMGKKVVVLVIRDITERKHAERMVRRTETRIQNAMQLGNIAWLEIDCRTGEVTILSSKASMLGFEPGTFRHYTDFTCLLPPEDQERIRQAIGDVLDGKELRQDMVFRIRSHSGEYLWLRIIGGISETDVSGRPLQITCFVVDITEQQRAEAMIRLVNHNLKLLMSSTSHDIINNITELQGYLNQAVNHPGNAILNKSSLDDMLDITQTMKSHAEFSQLYQHLGDQEPRWFRVEQVIRGLSVPVEFTFIMDLHDIEIYADPLLEMVFSTLLDTTIRHSRTATKIVVSYRKEPGTLVLIWEDNGRGIPVGEKERIFECKFGKTAGPGLFLVYDILGITGIMIHETGAEGEGTRFEIVIPEGTYRFSKRPDEVP